VELDWIGDGMRAKRQEEESARAVESVAVVCILYENSCGFGVGGGGVVSGSALTVGESERARERERREREGRGERIKEEQRGKNKNRKRMNRNKSKSKSKSRSEPAWILDLRTMDGESTNNGVCMYEERTSRRVGLKYRDD
jgi:hypothetical protein